jgi:cytochrome c nitrite reductase small subunit
MTRSSAGGVIGAIARVLTTRPEEQMITGMRPGQAEHLFQLDPVEYYGSRALTVVLIIGIVIVLYNLVRYRGRTTGPFSWVLLFAGGAIVPMLSLGFGTALVLEKAERVEFCASCHLTMKSYVDDMKNPKSESLAAIHYKNRYIASNQCYTCHTSYGMFGTVEAKMSGMTDLYKYYTRTFHLPIKMRGTYPNEDCLKCHAGSVKWPVIHDDFKEQLFKGEMACLDCHRDEHPAHILPPVRPAAQVAKR